MVFLLPCITKLGFMGELELVVDVIVVAVEGANFGLMAILLLVL